MPRMLTFEWRLASQGRQHQLRRVRPQSPRRKHNPSAFVIATTMLTLLGHYSNKRCRPSRLPLRGAPPLLDPSFVVCFPVLASFLHLPPSFLASNRVAATTNTCHDTYTNHCFCAGTERGGGTNLVERPSSVMKRRPRTPRFVEGNSSFPPPITTAARFRPPPSPTSTR